MFRGGLSTDLTNKADCYGKKKETENALRRKRKQMKKFEKIFIHMYVFSFIQQDEKGNEGKYIYQRSPLHQIMLSSNQATFVRSLYTPPELPDKSFPVLSRKK